MVELGLYQFTLVDLEDVANLVARLPMMTLVACPDTAPPPKISLNPKPPLCDLPHLLEPQCGGRFPGTEGKGCFRFGLEGCSTSIYRKVELLQAHRTMSNSPWHFPRTEFAERVIQAFMSGGSTALTLFAPRRTGKTQFLVHDLAPAAEKKKCTVVYASFWQTADTPVATLTHAIEGAIKTPNFWRRTQDALTGMKPKIRIAPMGIGGEVDLSRDPTPADPQDPLLTLDNMIGQLPATYETPLLLMLDEVQGLAAAEHLSFVAALRTSLDKRRETVRTIFTGSSMDGLRAMFSDRQAPFFHFGSNIELPPLGEPFVRHILAAHKAATKRDVPLKPALEFFTQVDRSPFMMRSVLERMALDPDDDFETAAHKVRHELAERQGYPVLWSDLNSLAQAVLIEIVRGETSLTSKAARTRMAKAISDTEVSPGRVSGALRTLGRKNIIHKIADDWTVQDPEFGRYIASLFGQ